MCLVGASTDILSSPCPPDSLCRRFRTSRNDQTPPDRCNRVPNGDEDLFLFFFLLLSKANDCSVVFSDSAQYLERLNALKDKFNKAHRVSFPLSL